MRITVELPDEPFRRLKANAALNGLTLKDLITRYLEQGLKHGAGRVAGGKPSRRRRSPIRVIERATTGKPIVAVSRDELARIELDDDLAKDDRSARR